MAERNAMSIICVLDCTIHNSHRSPKKGKEIRFLRLIVWPQNCTQTKEMFDGNKGGEEKGASNTEAKWWLEIDERRKEKIDEIFGQMTCNIFTEIHSMFIATWNVIVQPIYPLPIFYEVERWTCAHCVYVEYTHQYTQPLHAYKYTYMA